MMMMIMNVIEIPKYNRLRQHHAVKNETETGLLTPFMDIKNRHENPDTPLHSTLKFEPSENKSSDALPPTLSTSEY